MNLDTYAFSKQPGCESKGTPGNVNIRGYLFNIDTEALTLIVDDPAPQCRESWQAAEKPGTGTCLEPNKQ